MLVDLIELQDAYLLKPDPHVSQRAIAFGSSGRRRNATGWTTDKEGPPLGLLATTRG